MTNKNADLLESEIWEFLPLISVCRVCRSRLHLEVNRIVQGLCQKVTAPFFGWFVLDLRLDNNIIIN